MMASMRDVLVKLSGNSLQAPSNRLSIEQYASMLANVQILSQDASYNGKTSDRQHYRQFGQLRSVAVAETKAARPTASRPSAAPLCIMIDQLSSPPL